MSHTSEVKPTSRSLQVRRFSVLALRRTCCSTIPAASGRATPEAPRWLHVDVGFVKKTRLVGLPELRSHPELANMRVLARGNRLSITPVEPAEWRFIVGQLPGANDLQDWK